MIHKIKKALKTRKVKLFFIFLLCSGLAWFISNLSDPITSHASFELQFSKAHDNYVVTSASKDEVNVKLRAVGFQFLRFAIKKQKILLDLSMAERIDSTLFIAPKIYRRQIERQLSNSMTLLEVDDDTIFFGFFEVESKRVAIRPKMQLNLSQNFLLDGELLIQPDSITIRGPKNEIDSIEYIQTIKTDLTSVTSSFSQRVDLEISPLLKNTTFSARSTVLKGKVARYSENVVEVPITVINLPTALKIRTFPKNAKVVCKAKFNVLKQLSASDFEVVADYSSIEGTESNTLLLHIARQPQNIESARLEETHVEFILNRQ